MIIHFTPMRQRFIGSLLVLLFIPIAGSSRLGFVVLRALLWRPRLLLMFAGGVVVFATGGPMIDQLQPEEVRLIESPALFWGAVALGILIVGYGVRARVVRRLWRQVW